MEMDTERQASVPVRRRSEGSLVAQSMWGAGILISIAIVAGSTAITFALLRASLFWSMNLGELSRGGITAPNPDGKETTVPSPGSIPTPTKDTLATTSIGTAPLLGNPKTAKVAIIEWSDLECPFCKKFHDDTFDKIVSDYVDTGKAVFVFRNYPLDFHGDASIKEANAALCVREAKGDKAYFSFIKDSYANTGLNGKGISDDMLSDLVSKNSGSSLSSCLESRKFKSVIDADLSAGNDAGISATPSFVIGKLGKGGTVTGAVTAGAMPYSEFKKTLDTVLGS